MNSIVSKRLRVEGVGVGGVDVEADGVPYGVEAVTIDYGLVRLDSGRSKRSKRTMDGFEGTDACLACFEGSRWIQSAVGVNLSSKRAEIGLERFEQSPIRQQLSYACFGGLYGSRRTSNGSVAALNVTESRGD
jgi:hypothetical protein